MSTKPGLNVDAGTEFGLWLNSTAQLIYHDLMPALLNGVDRNLTVGDLGGGNGLLRAWFPNVVTVDTDEAKRPDVVADILEYRGTFDLIVLRYVLHYLSDASVRRLFHHLATYHAGPVIVIQFVNENLELKLRNSVNESKFFRNEEQLRGLLSPWVIRTRRAFEYTVEAEFYRARLGHPDPVSHEETILSLLLER